MARKALEPGMVIELQRQGQEGFEAFTIRKVIGKGGICIAYEVECPNGMIGRLKEFYPAQATGKGYMFSREGKMLFYNPECQITENYTGEATPSIGLCLMMRESAMTR